MQKFVLKFFILFVLTVSFLFFGLVGFQKREMEQHTAMFRPPYNVPMPDMPPRPVPAKTPPIFIPAFLIILLSSSFVFFLLKYLDKNFVSPLIAIKSGVKKIKEGGLDVEFKTKSEDTTVQETFDTLNSMVLGLVEKERLRENFIAMLSHDLRTPVLAQERAISILKEEFGTHELLDGMFENNEEYLRMINLIVETFNAKDIEIKKEKFNLERLIDTVLLALKGPVCNNNITTVKNIPENFTIFADYISFHRIFMNLISNSIENAGQNKTVKIEAKNEAGKSVITVLDNGSGIEDEVLEHIFDKYASFKKGKKGKTVSGLGLYIAHELTEKNGGKLKVETEKGSFTKFIIEI